MSNLRMTSKIEIPNQ